MQPPGKSVKNIRESTVTRRGLLAGGAATVAVAAGAARAASHAFELEADVVVVGTGSAGSTAALFAHEAGAKVLMVDKGAYHGGTSSKSGGEVWIPNHEWLRRKGLADERDDFLRYVVRCSFPVGYDASSPTFGAPPRIFELLETFYGHGSLMVEGLGRMKALRTQMLVINGGSLQDYYSQLPEDKRTQFRILATVPRVPDGSFGGDEMMGQLAEAVGARGIPVHLRHEATALIRNGHGEVIGVEVSDPGKRRIRIGARRGVVFASGGYAHNKDLLQNFQAAPVFGACAAPTATGDFIGMSSAVGAKLGNTGGAWRGQVVLDDAIRYRAIPADAFMIFADSYMNVNRFGVRCCNERRSYHDKCKSHYVWDETRAEYPNLLQFAIYDQRSAEMYGGPMPIPPYPEGADYVIRGETIGELARAIDARLEKFSSHTGGLRLDTAFAATLQKTIARFNAFAESGKDLDYGRGDHDLDRSFSLPPAKTSWPANDKPNPLLYPFQSKGPYFAIILAPGVLDTNGGPVIDSGARVLDTADRPIGGLFGAGNCIASPAQDAYWGAGCTLALAMTFGMIAGQSAAKAKARELRA